MRLEGGQIYSATLRDIFKVYHGVKVGAYSYGECFVPGVFPSGVTVGRYVSIAANVRIFLRNHPYERLSMHPFFYNYQLGFVDTDTIESGSLKVGHDAWIGENAIVTPGCNRIGLGAVVGAGSVITKNVDDFAIMAGNPARLLRYRFTEEVRDKIRTSRWWERPASQCVAILPEMIKSLEDQGWQHPFFSGFAMHQETVRKSIT